MKGLLLVVALMLGVSMAIPVPGDAAPKHVVKHAVVQKHVVKKDVGPYPKSRNYMSQKGYDRYQNYLKTGKWS
jgi:hypothetical protein